MIILSISLIIVALLLISPMALLCTWIVSSPIVTNYINRPWQNPFFGSYRLIDRFYSVSGFDIRELFTFDRIVLLLLFAAILFSKKNVQLIKFNKIDLPFLYFLGAIFISTLYSHSIIHRTRIAVDTFGLCYIAYFIGKNMLSKDENFNKCLNAVLILGCTLIAVSLTEFYTHSDIFLYRITGPFLYWENLGLTLGIIFFIVLFKKNSAELTSKATRLFYNILIVLLIVTIFLTYTRTIMFTVLAGIFFIGLKGKAVLRKEIVRKYNVFVFLIIFIVAFSPILLVNTNFYQHRLTKRTDDGRLESYLLALRIFGGNPIQGIGLKDYRDDKIKYMTKEEKVKDDFRMSESTSCHNSYLVTASEMGLMGLIPMILIVNYTYRFCRKYYHHAENRNEKLWALTMGALTVVYFLSALTFDPFFETTIDNKLYYMCLGISVGRYKTMAGENQ
jgi:O-antigen ligase